MNTLKSSCSRIFINEVDEAQSLSVHDYENELLEELMMKDMYNPRPLHFFLKELQVKAKERAKHPLQTTPSSAAACHYKSSTSNLQDKKLDRQVDQDQDQDELDALFWDGFYNPQPLHVFLEELNEPNDKEQRWRRLMSCLKISTILFLLMFLYKKLYKIHDECE